MTWLTFLILWVSVFATYIIGDWLYAAYIRAVADASPMRAAFISMLIHGVYIFGTVGYLKNLWLVIPCLIGSGVGTYLSTAKTVKAPES
jgi:hypothetical protein